MSLLDKNTLRILFTTLAMAALIAFVWLARKPLLVFLFAMLFAYLLEPLIARLERRKHCSRGVAIAATYVAMLAVLLTVGLLVGPRVVEQGQHLYQAAPELYNRVASGSIAFQVGKARGWSWETETGVQQFIVGHRDQVLAAICALAAVDSGSRHIFSAWKKPLCPEYRGPAGQSAPPPTAGRDHGRSE
jgi:predicted PurR-regulated permease PerM